MMQFDAVVVGRSYEQVVHQIRDAVAEGRLAPGQKLPPERELAESFGVSRGVVREAIKVLTAMGLVEARQGSGTFVRTGSLPSIRRSLIFSVQPEEHALDHLFEFRRWLEADAARAATRRRTDAQLDEIRAAAAANARGAAAGDVEAFSLADFRFHAAVYAAAGNPYLETALATVRDMQRDVVGLFTTIAGSMSVAAEQHRRITEAIAAGDGEAAAAAMTEHISYAAEVVFAALAERGLPPGVVVPDASIPSSPIPETHPGTGR